MKVLAKLLTIPLVIVLSGCESGNASSSSKERLELDAAVEMILGVPFQDYVASKCTELETKLIGLEARVQSSIDLMTFYEPYLDSLTDGSSNLDYFETVDSLYEFSVSSEFESLEDKETIEASIVSIVTELLEPVEQKVNLEEYYLGGWVPQFKSASTSACNTSLFASLSSSGEDLDWFRQRIEHRNSLGRPSPQWYPDGFQYFSDDVAIKNVKGRGCDYGSCWNYDIVTRTACSSLYVELNVYDSSGAVIDWTNDTARNVSAGEIVKIQLNTYEDEADTGRITEINCR